ncbi:hypothetical protein [Rhodococcoides fascians]|uniref:hypothetical protein n=1 Tax=Rhodococcoides fascians TaxID=1828 RepID=UPI00055E9F4E|nr:hypothetical protein [Rhodococcus fascians]
MTDRTRAADPFTLDDENTVELGRFLRAAPLSNGAVAQIPGGQSELLAQSVLNWLHNAVYEGGEWITRADLESTPEFGDVEVTILGDEEAVKLRHRRTGIVALELTKPEAWASLKDKVRKAREAGQE